MDPVMTNENELCDMIFERGLYFDPNMRLFFIFKNDIEQCTQQDESMYPVRRPWQARVYHYLIISTGEVLKFTNSSARSAAITPIAKDSQADMLAPTIRMLSLQVGQMNEKVDLLNQVIKAMKEVKDV